MQALHFYTRRLVLLTALVFFGFLFLIASRSPSTDSDDPRGWSPNRGRFAQPMAMRPGEQRAEPPQAPPVAGLGWLPYSQLGMQSQLQSWPLKCLILGIPSTRDIEVVERLRMHLRDVDLKALAAATCPKNITLATYWAQTQTRAAVPRRDSWERFYADISSCDLYHDDSLVDTLLHDMATLPIKHAAIMEGGTQVKLVFTFTNDKQAVFKPMRFGRDYETDPNHFYFGDFERHNAEIATFHLDKILGYRRAVPTVGRVVNVSGELREAADRKLRKTFFVSPAKNHCFVGKCDYYCDTTHAICATPDLKEGSVQMFLPDDTSVPRHHNKSPYRRTYSKRTQLADWQTDLQYCNEKVKSKLPYAHGRRILDLVDLHILDYLIGNQDRHHYETFSVFSGFENPPIHLDHGRSFGRTNIDDDDILMPLRQCCVIRATTLERLLLLYAGPKSLTETLHESLARDPIAPVLAYKHYPAMERRLARLMRYVLECMDKSPGRATAVVLAEFHNPEVSEALHTGDEEGGEPPEDEAAAAAVVQPPDAAAGLQPPPPPPPPLPPVDNEARARQRDVI